MSSPTSESLSLSALRENTQAMDDKTQQRLAYHWTNFRLFLEVAEGSALRDLERDFDFEWERLPERDAAAGERERDLDPPLWDRLRDFDLDLDLDRLPLRLREREADVDLDLERDPEREREREGLRLMGDAETSKENNL